MKRFEVVIMVAALSCTVIAADTHFIGSTNSDWLTASNWDAGLPTSATGSFAFIDGTVNAQVNTTGAVADECTVDNGRTLTIGSSGVLTLRKSGIPSLRLSQAGGDAALVVDGGTLDHAGRYGGDFSCGQTTGHTSVTINSGTWKVRGLRLCELRDPATGNFGLATAVVASTAEIVQNNGTVNLEAGYAGTGYINIPYSSGGEATYTINDGVLTLSNLRVCFGGSVSNPTHGVFNVNGGTVTILSSVRIGHKGTGVTTGGTTDSPNSTGLWNQTAGAVTAGNTWVGEGNKQGRLRISGGSYSALDMDNGLDGTGSVEVIGNTPSLTVRRAYRQNAKSKLSFTIGANGVAPVNVSGATTGTGSGTATFAADTFIEINVEPGTVISDAQEFTLMTTKNGIISSTFRVIGNACGYFTVAVVGNNLVATYHAAEDVQRCYVICATPPEYDFDGDCVVNSGDLVMLLDDWLECNLETCD